MFEWRSPPDGQLGSEVYDRTRTFTQWRVEPLGDRVRHAITAEWWSGAGRPEPPLLELQVCGKPGYGKFVLCSPTKCVVRDE